MSHAPIAVRMCVAALLLGLGSGSANPALACGDGGTTPPAHGAALALQPGAPYFSMAGKQQFVAVRNIAGRGVEEIEMLLDQAREQGTRLVRVHVTHLGGLGITSSGAVVEGWAASWDRIFAHAQADGISVIPVFGVWADWNDGSAGEGWHVWDQNPLNRANGGPAASPVELFTAGSAGQKAWLGWLGKLVARWQRHRNVAAWEVFSELNLVTRTGLDDAAFQGGGIAFEAAAAAVIRARDHRHRPVTASLSAWWQQWSPGLYASDGIDIVQLHLYSPGWDLDAMILWAVGEMRALGLGKPILVGESGLDWAAPDGSTATTAPEGPRATRHAVWAALISGAMNGRALWWEDGYDILQNNDDAAVAFVTGYPAVEAPALSFLRGRDLTGMLPTPVAMDYRLTGGAIGGEHGVLGWVRATSCQLSWGWDCSTVLSGSTVAVAAPATPASWQATFHDPSTGAVLGGPVAVAQDGSMLVIPLPDFSDDVAFELSAAP